MRALQCSDPSSRRRRQAAKSVSLEGPLGPYPHVTSSEACTRGQGTRSTWRQRAQGLAMRALQCSDPSSRRSRQVAASASRDIPVTGALHCTRTPRRWQAASMRSRTSRELLEAGKYLKLSSSVASCSPRSSSILPGKGELYGPCLCVAWSASSLSMLLRWTGAVGRGEVFEAVLLGCKLQPQVLLYPAGQEIPHDLCLIVACSTASFKMILK